MTANTAKTKSASTLTVPCAVTTAPWWMCQAFADLKRGVMTMAEYIERETAIKALMNDAPEQVGYSREDAADCIRYMDAADVAPVRHARWVDNHCTACGMMPMGDEMWKHLDLEPPLFERFMDYCPSCGCRMDG